MNLMKTKNANLVDKIDYGQRKGQNLGELIQSTLEMFEVNGGEDAFINIKYIFLPTRAVCLTEKGFSECLKLPYNNMKQKNQRV